MNATLTLNRNHLFVQRTVVVAAVALTLLTAGAALSIYHSRAAEPAALDLLQPALNGLTSGNSFERVNAVKALGLSSEPAATSALLRSLSDPDQAVGLQAARALGASTADVLPQLRAALGNANADVRWRAAMALGMQKDAAAVSGLAAALQDTDVLVQSNAAQALAQIGDQAAIDALVMALDGGRASTLQAALSALESIGAPAVPALVETVTSGQPAMAENAAIVLAYITGR